MLNPSIEIVLRAHGDEEAALLRAEALGTVFLGHDELARGIAAHLVGHMGLHRAPSESADAGNASPSPAAPPA